MPKRFVLLILLLCSPVMAASDEILVRGLLKNMVVLEVNGVQRMIKAGKTSPEGIKLISSNTKEAVVEINGEKQVLTLTRRVGGGSYDAPPKGEVRIARGVGNHYFTPGRINNRPVSFLVDTGATGVVLNSMIAKKLRIDYKKGVPTRMQTASGVEVAYRVMLKSVSVGTVKVNNVEALVNDGAFPSDILLGNTYLSRVDMNIDDGVLVLKAKF